MSSRTVRIKPSTWDKGRPSERVGIMLRVGAGVTVLTPAEAFATANRLVDVAERMLTTEQEDGHGTPKS